MPVGKQGAKWQESLRLRLPALPQAPGLARLGAGRCAMDAERCIEADVQRAVEPAYRSLAWCVRVLGAQMCAVFGTVQTPGWLALVRRLIRMCPGVRRQVSVCGLVWLVLCVGTWLLSPARSDGASQLRLEALSALPEAMLATRFAGSQAHFTQLFSSSSAAATALA